MGQHGLPQPQTFLFPPSQTTYPWRAVVRTVFQAAVALATLIPIIVATGGIPATGAVLWVLGVCGAVTRVMAIPAVNEILARLAPWLLAEPKQDER